MARKPESQSAGVMFPDGTVFVRPTSDEERREFLSGNFAQPFYTVVDEEGERLTIVCGAPCYAFATAREHNALPTWIH